MQRGGNKQPIPNQRNAYTVFILTFDYRLQRHHLVLDLNAASGLLTSWEAIRFPKDHIRL